MKWQRIIERLSQPQTTEGLAQDPFFYMGATPGPKSKVSYTVGRSLAYGDLKVSATVTIECPQTELHINTAAEIVFDKAKELVDDAFCGIVPDAVRLLRDFE